MSELPRGVIGVPGNWRDHEEVVQSISQLDSGWAHVGQALANLETGRTFVLEEYSFEPRMRDAFTCAGAGRIPEKELGEIADHKMTLYVSSDVGSVETTLELMDAARVLLDGGGLGVKVESSGVAHSKSIWPDLCDDTDMGAKLHAMVAFVGDDNSFYSCGMHHFGLRDVVVQDTLDPLVAGKIMEGFCSYQLMEAPAMLDGETFSLQEGEPRYQLHREPCHEFAEGDLFHNPYGIWRLVPHTESEL